MEEKRVLLIDDDEEFVSTLAERLRLRGFRVETAGEVAEAFVLVHELSPGVIVFDVGMGVDFVRRFVAEYPEIPLIVLTDIGENRLAEEAVRLGARCHLMKPFAIEELIEAMGESLG
jgi:ActR/RegA family two-component response regulator